jgi:hypothetical protein
MTIDEDDGAGVTINTGTSTLLISLPSDIFVHQC